MFHFKQFSVEDSHCPLKVNTDAILLGAWTTASAPEQILEIGTGCGIVSLMLAQRYPKAHITAIEIEAKAAEQAGHNFASSPWPTRLAVRNIAFMDFVSSNTRVFDLVISNPPYFTPLPVKSTNSIAKHSVSLHYVDLLKAGNSLLKEHAALNLILPAHEIRHAINCAQTHQLFCNKIVEFHPFPRSQAVRSILVLQKHQQKQGWTIEKVNIRDQNKAFSEVYRKKTAAFHPDQYLQ